MSMLLSSDCLTSKGMQLQPPFQEDPTPSEAGPAHANKEEECPPNDAFPCTLTSLHPILQSLRPVYLGRVVLWQL